MMRGGQPRDDRSGPFETITGLLFVVAVVGIITLAPSAGATDPMQESQKLLASDGEGGIGHGDSFGIGASLDGDTLLVGARNDDISGISSAGSAYVFTRNVDGDWIEQAKLTEDNPAEGDQFGLEVDLDGDRAIIGAQYDDNAFGEDAGSAFIFQRTNGTWTQEAQLTASDAHKGGWFGMDAVIDGDTAIVGGGDEEKGDGTAYVFERNESGAWNEEQNLSVRFWACPDCADEFGGTMDLEGDRAVIGAGDLARAYVFDRDGGNWSLSANLTPSGDGSGSEPVGNVAVDGARILIGTNGDDEAADFAGAAYVFDQNATGEWNETAKLMASDAEQDQWFGSDVGLEGDRAVISDSQSRGYIFQYQGGSWTEVWKLVPGDHEEEDWVTSDIDGNTVVLGIGGARNASGDMTGASYIYHDIPSRLTASPGSSSGSIELGWHHSPTPSTSFRVYRGTSDTGPFTQIAQTPDQTYLDTDLDHRTYHYRVTAVNDGGVETEPSNLNSSLPRPPIPSNLEATAGADAGEIDLEWDEPPEPSEEFRYNVYRATSEFGSFSLIGQTVESTYNDTDLDHRTYHYFVTAIDSNDVESERSNQSAAVPRPYPPANVAADPGAEIGDIHLAWETPPNTTQSFTYHVERANDSSGPYTEIATTTNLDYTDTDLGPGTYHYRIIAEDNGGLLSDPSTIASSEPEEPAPPGEFQATASGEQNAVRLSWFQPPNATLTYRIERATSPSGPYTEIATTTDMPYEDTGLDARTYHYRVVAEHELGFVSDPVEASVHPRPPAPENIATSPGDEAGQIVVDWDPPSGTTETFSYRVFRSTQSGGPHALVTETDATSFVDGGLDPGTSYHYVVTALESDGMESPISTETDGQPAGGPIDIVTGLLDPSSEPTDDVQNDAGTGGDASDDPGDPTILAGGELIHINGTLHPTTDPIDAYGTQIEPNATISMSFNYTAPASMNLNVTLIAPNNTTVDQAQAPPQGGPVSVGVKADPGDHLDEGTWITVLEHGLAPPQPLSMTTTSTPNPWMPWMRPAATPTPGTSTERIPNLATTLGTETFIGGDGTVPGLVPDELTMIDYRDKRPCHPNC